VNAGRSPFVGLMDAVRGQERARKATEAADSDAAFERELARMLVREVGKTLESALGGQEGAAVQGVLEEALVDRLVVDGLFDTSRPGAGAPPTWRGRGDHAVRPVAGRISSDFGIRRDPFHGRRRQHRGIDLSAPLGAPVVAARSGTVRFAGDRGGYGNLVIVDHGGGVETWYAHLDRIDVSPGSRVAAGRDLGTVGQTGRATGPHLHFEVRENGVAVDPAGWFGRSAPSADPAAHPRGSHDPHDHPDHDHDH
jgi:murein DD-endopeptidase MepM/ murein hydrolase activator NlpD